MKLIFCSKCGDIFNLKPKEKRCSCGLSGGRYKNSTFAIYWGHYAIPLGLINESLSRAIEMQPRKGEGKRFDAFVIPIQSPTFERKKAAE